MATVAKIQKFVTTTIPNRVGMGLPSGLMADVHHRREIEVDGEAAILAHGD